MTTSTITTVPVDHSCGHHAQFTVETAEHELSDVALLQSIGAEHPCLDCLAAALHEIHPLLDWTPAPVVRAKRLGVTGPLAGGAWRVEAVHGLVLILSSPGHEALLPTEARRFRSAANDTWFSLLNRTLTITDGDTWCDIAVNGWAVWFVNFALFLRSRREPGFEHIAAPLSKRNYSVRDWRQWVSGSPADPQAH